MNITVMIGHAECQGLIVPLTGIDPGIAYDLDAVMRLQLRALQNARSGMARAMCCIARYELFHRTGAKLSGEMLDPRIRKNITNALSAWCGRFSEKTKDDIGWFSAYISLSLLTCRMLDGEKSIIKKYRLSGPEAEEERLRLFDQTASEIRDVFAEGFLKTETGWAKKLPDVLLEKERKCREEGKSAEADLYHTAHQIFEGNSGRRIWKGYALSLNRYWEASILEPWRPGPGNVRNTEKKMKAAANRITYDRIIAEALAKGPLKNRVLLMKEEALEKTYYLGGRPEEKGEKEAEPVRRKVKQKDQLMKAVSCILLQQQTDLSEFYAAPAGADEDCFAPSKYTTVTRADYINWIRMTNDTAVTELLSGTPGEIPSMIESGRYRDYIWYEETRDEVKLVERHFL